MAVVLIGSTGNGKSTLGNYLLNPSEEHITSSQTFKTAQDNKPHTQEVKLGKLDESSSTDAESNAIPLTLVDTPGLNESSLKDLHNMIGIIQALQDVGKVQACILVVKFNTKIDVQYKATVSYYSKLLPDLFKNNVIVVMTDYATDQRSVDQRKRSNINEGKIKQNTVLEIRSSGKLTYDPKVFLIDCLPFGTEEKEKSSEVRKQLLNYIYSLKSVEVDTMRVAKTDSIKQSDAKKIDYLVGKNKAYRKNLEVKSQDSVDALKEVDEKEGEITCEEGKLKSLQTELKALDNNNTETVGTWTTEEEAKRFSTITKTFQLHSEWRISQVTKWSSDNDKVQWKEFTEGLFSVKGTISGVFRGGLHASVTIYSTKKVIYKKEIDDLEKKIEDATKRVELLRKESRDITKRNEKHSAVITQLKEKIERRRAKINELQLETMDIPDALKKLEKLQREEK